MAYEFKTSRRIQFADTDMAGIVHFANFFRFMEEAEHEFYRTLGFAGHFSGPRGTLGWPRLSARCDYRKPLRFEDEVEIHLLVRAKEEKSLLLDFIFRKRSQDGPQVVAVGALKVVCVQVSEETGRMSSIPIPPEISSRIDAAPSHLLESH